MINPKQEGEVGFN